MGPMFSLQTFVEITFKFHVNLQLGLLYIRAGARAVDLGGPSVYQGGQSLNLSTKAVLFKRESLFIGGGKHVDWGGQAPLPPLGAGPAVHSSCVVMIRFLPTFCIVKKFSMLQFIT